MAHRLLEHLQNRGASFAQEMRTACPTCPADCRTALGELVAEGLIASDGSLAYALSQRHRLNDASTLTLRGDGSRSSGWSRTLRRTGTRRDEAVKALAWTLLSVTACLPSSVDARGQRRHVARTSACLSDARGRPAATFAAAASSAVCRVSNMRCRTWSIMLRELRRSDRTIGSLRSAAPIHSISSVSSRWATASAPPPAAASSIAMGYPSWRWRATSCCAYAGRCRSHGAGGRGRDRGGEPGACVAGMSEGFGPRTCWQARYGRSVRLAQRVRRWRRGIALDPRYQEPKGEATLWTRARRLLWSWWPWFVVSIATAYDNRWGWAFSTGAMAFVSYLVTPIETPPR